jgi:hypothetical protein
VGKAPRVEEEAVAIVPNPVGLRICASAGGECFLIDVETPVALNVDRRVRIPEHIADVAAEIKHVLTLPHRIAELLGKIRKLPRSFGKENQGSP